MHGYNNKYTLGEHLYIKKYNFTYKEYNFIYHEYQAYQVNNVYISNTATNSCT